ncbi:MAG TPA: winged helix DNA-binding domain-containing protein [Gemmatimonadaceae bacterium]|nr:winged helix DNA-binding domain-containing protein [Gemmatimonadaceae bacterium]
MNQRDIVQRRLAGQDLVAPPITTPVDVVRRLGAMQAQDYSGAKWAIGLRSRNLVDATVERAMADGSIIRTHVLRPTWHFVAPADIRWMLALTAPRVKATMASYDRKLELDDAVFRRSNAAITRALRDGAQLTRSELADALRRARVDVTGSQRLAHLVARAELDGVVCSGAPRGKKFTYALLEERVPPARALDRDEALLELTTRYFATRGPATMKDFAWWSGLTVADATRGLQMAGQVLENDVMDGSRYWFDASAPPRRAPRMRSPASHLLPNYDEYFIGHKDRRAIGARLASTAIVTGGSALISNVIVIDGQLVGGWKRTLLKDSAIVEASLLARLTAREVGAVSAAARAYGKFLGVPVELRGLRAS